MLRRRCDLVSLDLLFTLPHPPRSKCSPGSTPLRQHRSARRGLEYAAAPLRQSLPRLFWRCRQLQDSRGNSEGIAAYYKSSRRGLQLDLAFIPALRSTRPCLHVLAFLCTFIFPFGCACASWL